MIDASRLMKEEREEIRRALVLYKYDYLDKLSESGVFMLAADARWRKFVVETLLAEVRD